MEAGRRLSVMLRSPGMFAVTSAFSATEMRLPGAQATIAGDKNYICLALANMVEPMRRPSGCMA
jgi:hypothetical protein